MHGLGPLHREASWLRRLRPLAKASRLASEFSRIARSGLLFGVGVLAVDQDGRAQGHVEVVTLVVHDHLNALLAEPVHQGSARRRL